MRPWEIFSLAAAAQHSASFATAMKKAGLRGELANSFHACVVPKFQSGDQAEKSKKQVRWTNDMVVDHMP